MYQRDMLMNFKRALTSYLSPFWYVLLLYNFLHPSILDLILLRHHLPMQVHFHFQAFPSSSSLFFSHSLFFFPTFFFLFFFCFFSFFFIFFRSFSCVSSFWSLHLLNRKKRRMRKQTPSVHRQKNLRRYQFRLSQYCR